MLNQSAHQLPLDDPDRLSLLFAAVADAQHIALAVSGGVDSLSLLHLTAKWRGQTTNPPAITVLTVDHGLRAEAQEETAFVAQTAAALGLEVQILRGEVTDPESGLQAKARELRYSLMGEAMHVLGIHTLLTGHHLDDQAETILMRLARGSGITGLGGMAPFTVRGDIALVRPLLNVTRQELEDYVGRLDLDPVRDPSNHNLNFERVRWRKLMPQLQELGMSSEKMGNAAMRLRRADQALIELTEQLYADLILIDPFGCVHFETEMLIKQPAELGVRLLFRAIDDAGGEHDVPSLSQVEKLYDHISANIIGLSDLTVGGCGIKFKDGMGQIFRELGRMPDEKICVQPGGTYLWDKRFRVLVAEDHADDIVIAPAADFSRKKLDNLLPDLPFVPIQAVRSSPLVMCGDDILALGEHVMTSQVDVFCTFGPNALM